MSQAKKSMRKTRKQAVITIAILVLFILTAITFSNQARSAIKVPIEKTARLVLGNKIVDCSQKIAQEEADQLAQMVKGKNSTEDCIFMGCDNFFR